MLANETMNHKPLIISGSSDFKKSVIQSAIFANLSVSFADQLMQNEFIHQKEIIKNDRKKLAEQTAKKILERIENTMDYVFAASHVEYINREKAFARRGGCIFHSHKLPKWAKNDPKKFFKAADKYESKGTGVS